jgi:hypothetical protein
LPAPDDIRQAFQEKIKVDEAAELVFFTDESGFSSKTAQKLRDCDGSCDF